MMTLRKSLGGDVQAIHEQVDALLDRPDGVLMLFDGNRVVTYGQGFGISASQLELLGVELERALRDGVGQRPSRRAYGRRNRVRHQSDQPGDRIGRDRGDPAVPVLQLAKQVA
jgi:hypothetical protein